MTTDQLLSFLQHRFPEDIQEKYDNTGIQVRSEDNRVNGVYLSLDINSDTVDRALSKGCNVIITHHPLIFKPLKHVQASHYKESVVYKLIRNSMTLYSIHTSMDKIYCLKTSELLGLQASQVLIPDNSSNELGFGSVGELVPAISFGTLLEKVSHSFNAEYLHYTGNPDTLVKTVGVLNGSGGSEIYSFLGGNVDCVITGDLKYHEAFDASMAGLCVIDAGHFWTEKFFMDQLKTDIFKYLTKMDMDTAIVIDDVEKNPLKLYIRENSNG